MNTPTAAPPAGNPPAAQAALTHESAEKAAHVQAIKEEKWYHLRTGFAIGVAVGILAAAWTFFGHLADPRQWPETGLILRFGLTFGSLILGTLGGGQWAYHVRKSESPAVGAVLATLGVIVAFVLAALWCPNPFAGIAMAGLLIFMGWAASTF